MKKLSILFLSLIFFSFITGDYNSTRISSHVIMNIQKDLIAVPKYAETKFSEQTAPMAVYESADQDVKLVVKLKLEVEDSTNKPKFKSNEAKKSTAKDIDLEKMFKKSSISASFDAVTFHQDTIKEINGTKFIVFEYTADASGMDEKGAKTISTTYAYYQIAYVKNKTYIFNFYCPADRKAEWQKHAGVMMNSINIRK